MAESLATNTLKEVTPCDVISTQEIIEAIKPKPLHATRQSQRKVVKTDLLPDSYLLENFQLDEVSTQTLMENIKKPIGQSKIIPTRTEITTIPETDTQTIIKNIRPIRACQAARKEKGNQKGKSN